MAKSKFTINHFLQPPTTELSHFLAGDNQLVICNGVNPSYKKGTLMKDLGYSIVGSTIQSGKSVLGLHNSRRTSPVQEMLATVDDSTSDDTQLFYSTGGAWTEITDAETAWANKAGISVEMEDFIGYTFFVGYGSTDGFLPVRTLTGSGHTFGTTLTTSMPSAKYIRRYRDRLYIANCDISGTAYPYRVYFSSVPSGGSISWTVASDFIDVDYSEQITGIEENWDRFIIFTEKSAYFYNQDEFKKVWEIGCVNNRTIQKAGDYVIWANKDNVWASTGGRPSPIANDILELLRASTSSNWRSSIVDNEYNLYLGATTSNGLSYTNCMATFNIDTGMWRWRELADAITSMACRLTGGDDYLWLGASDGDVHVKSRYIDASPVYTDNTASIRSHFRTKAYDFGDPSIRKFVSSLVAYAAYGGNLRLFYRVFDKSQESVQAFKELKNLNEVVTVLTDKGMKGHFIQFEGKEYSGNQSWEFYGFTAIVSAETEVS